MKWINEKRKVEDLKPAEYNPRQATEKEVKDLTASLDRFDLADPIIINKDNTVIGGHFRLRILKQKGVTEVDVRMPEEQLTKEQERELNIRLNKNNGEWNFDLLANFEIDDLLEWGFDEKDLQIEKDDLENTEPIKNIKDIKILNLYSSIGGNRRLWGDLDVTAVEYNEEIANIYRDYYPNDKVIVTDAHKYLEEHFDEYDFIWASPPCPTHSRLRKNFGNNKAVYPDMRLWQEILFLQGYFKGKWVVENVITWYDPLIEAQERGRHYYWSNFDIPGADIFNQKEIGSIDRFDANITDKKWGYDLTKYKISSKYPKDKILRDMVHPEVGKYILECAYNKAEKI